MHKPNGGGKVHWRLVSIHTERLNAERVRDAEPGKLRIRAERVRDGERLLDMFLVEQAV